MTWGLAFVALGLVLFSAGVWVGLWLSAPIGYQDRRGFHLGEPDQAVAWAALDEHIRAAEAREKYESECG